MISRRIKPTCDPESAARQSYRIEDVALVCGGIEQSGLDCTAPEVIRIHIINFVETGRDIGFERKASENARTERMNGFNSEAARCL